MTSPFKTFEEFSNAEGPIYTFANNPTMITILLIVSLLITAYFFYISFSMKQGEPPISNASALGLLLIAGFASMMGTLFSPHTDKQVEATDSRRSNQELPANRKTWVPLAFLGLTGIGGVTARRNLKRRSPRKLRH